MKKGDLVNDTRCAFSKRGKAGLVLYVDAFDETAQVLWPSGPYPTCALEEAGKSREDTLLAYSADPM